MHQVNRIYPLQATLTALMVTAVMLVGFSTANATHTNLHLFSDADLFIHREGQCPARSKCVFEVFPTEFAAEADKCPGVDPLFTDTGCANSNRKNFDVQFSVQQVDASCKGKQGCNAKLTTFTEQDIVNIIDTLAPRGLNVPIRDDLNFACWALVPRSATFLLHVRTCNDNNCNTLGQIVWTGEADFPTLFEGTIEEEGCREDSFVGIVTETCNCVATGNCPCPPLF